MPLSLNGSGGITYPDGTVNTTRSVSVAGDTMSGRLNLPEITIGGVGATNLNSTNWGLAIVPAAGKTNGSFAITNDNGTIVRLGIDYSGRIKMPGQPAFYSAGGQIVSTTSGGILPFITALTNRGSHYNTGTYKFTAPVAGVYTFTMRITFSSSGQGTAPFFAINGALMFGNSIFTEVFGYNSVNGYHTTSSVTTIVSLNANDAVDARTQVFNSSPQNLDLSRCSFGGYLIG